MPNEADDCILIYVIFHSTSSAIVNKKENENNIGLPSFKVTLNKITHLLYKSASTHSLVMTTSLQFASLE